MFPKVQNLVLSRSNTVERGYQGPRGPRMAKIIAVMENDKLGFALIKIMVWASIV
jgi:hypothetical protein